VYDAERNGARGEEERIWGEELDFGCWASRRSGPNDEKERRGKIRFEIKQPKTMLQHECNKHQVIYSI
jgi:hypothetical protein